MVGPGDCADDSSAAGVVLGRDAAGGAVASGGAPGGGADGVVREGEPDVLRLHPSSSPADLAEPNYRLVAFDGRCAPIATVAPRGHCSRPLVSSMRAKAEGQRPEPIRRSWPLASSVARGPAGWAGGRGLA